MPQFTGKAEFLNANGDVILTVDPEASSYPVVIRTAAGQTVMSAGAGLVVGGENNAGLVGVKDEADRIVFRLYSSTGHLYVGHEGQAGQISVLDEAGRGVLRLLGSDASLPHRVPGKYRRHLGE